MNLGSGEKINLKMNKERSGGNRKYKWSKYNLTVPTHKKNFLLYNTANQKMMTSEQSFERRENYYTDGAPLAKGDDKLVDLGFLVEESIDEFAKQRFDYQQHQGDRSQQIIVMPTEQCNFRCVYCYEEFLKGTMEPELQEGLISWVKANISNWDNLAISWFGGEPLVGYSVIENVSPQIIELCKENNVKYTSGMTTNGFLLNIEKAKKLYDMGVRSYQITVDGTEDYHDQTRVLMGGQKTYSKIMKNLLDIKDSDLDVSIKVRMNFSSFNTENISDFLDELSSNFKSDPRFTFDLQPVGQWGGPNDEELPICTSNQANLIEIDKTWEGIEKGIPTTKFLDALRPNNVCYAAKENSLVIGSDGIIYKCTVAFNNPMNHVGQLHPNGEIELDMYKFSQWVSLDGATDPHCQSCQVAPICHGSFCPLVRIEHGKDTRPCPPLKSNLEAYVKNLYKQITFSKEEVKQ
ncbi:MULTISPECIES: radical SAM/SPASM domain-containing protein [Halobacillus]|uniref:radical SAM/SPASM domain-containing protein n=1 Tax=Halobacillus TaxID=45667 RepID=UPI0009A5BA88|nr:MULTISPECIES: radical SAM protein [Halobacillus]